jgi:hypothetical protein
MKSEFAFHVGAYDRMLASNRAAMNMTSVAKSGQRIVQRSAKAKVSSSAKSKQQSSASSSRSVSSITATPTTLGKRLGEFYSQEYEASKPTVPSSPIAMLEANAHGLAHVLF